MNKKQFKLPSKSPNKSTGTELNIQKKENNPNTKKRTLLDFWRKNANHEDNHQALNQRGVKKVKMYKEDVIWDDHSNSNSHSLSKNDVGKKSNSNSKNFEQSSHSNKKLVTKTTMPLSLSEGESISKTNVGINIRNTHSTLKNEPQAGQPKVNVVQATNEYKINKTATVDSKNFENDKSGTMNEETKAIIVEMKSNQRAVVTPTQ